MTHFPTCSPLLASNFASASRFTHRSLQKTISATGTKYFSISYDICYYSRNQELLNFFSQIWGRKMIQCKDCEFYSEDAEGRRTFACDPFKNIKEPHCQCETKYDPQNPQYNTCTQMYIFDTANIFEHFQRFYPMANLINLTW